MDSNEISQDRHHMKPLNYSEKLFISKNQESRKKIDKAFNSISDTNNQKQITAALKFVTDIEERKELISKIIKRKKEIQKMKEINTINSLAPLFEKIKQKFFYNLYKKTGNQNHFSISQGRSLKDSQVTSQNSQSRVQSEQQINEQDANREDSKLDEMTSQSPQIVTPVNTPLDQMSMIKKQQHLFNALTFLATRSKSSKPKKSESGRGQFNDQNSTDRSYIHSGENKLQFLTRDPNVFKAELSYNKEQKKFIDKRNSIEGRGQNSSGDKNQNNNKKQNEQGKKSRVLHQNTHTSFKNQILTNHTSLNSLLNYENAQKKSLLKLNLPKKLATLSPSSRNGSKSENNKIFIEDWDTSNLNAMSNNKSASNQGKVRKNSIFKNQSLKSNDNSFEYDDYFPKNFNSTDKKNQTDSSYEFSNSLKPSQFSRSKREVYINPDGKTDDNQFIKGLPKVTNFGGHYYYLGKKLPNSYLYRYIIQCEQKRMFYQSNGTLFCNKPFDYELEKINSIQHIHKIIDPKTNEISILSLKHSENIDSSTLNFDDKIKSTPSSTKSKQSSVQGFPSINKQNPNSFMTSRRSTDILGNNTIKGNAYLNNTKDTESLFSNQTPDYLKPHILKGYYSPQSKFNFNDKTSKKYFVKCNYEK